jgi:hypothetical protein
VAFHKISRGAGRRDLKNGRGRWYCDFWPLDFATACKKRCVRLACKIYKPNRQKMKKREGRVEDEEDGAVRDKKSFSRK